ncbi:unnamed protein product [Mytilus coruscus]|uniref:Reverse transcriptase domain-containing protein n=1 Tax=Mytilus coruscus TaxID=42192 RepID=A0A6J8EVG7_MYTCO|nr:unnamed protein product [Mytilus coruscus]
MLSSQNSEADMNDEELAKAMVKLVKVGDNIPKSDEIILFGDFNTSLSPLDRVGKHIEDKAFKRISKLLDDFNIYDKNTDKKSNSIKEIENDNGKLLTSTQDILNEIKTFYEKLYLCTNIDESKMEEIGEFISKTVPEDDVNTCDDDITLVETFKSLNGSDIADTTASLRDIIKLIDEDNLEAYLIKIDQEKAFDRVDHKYLFHILEKFGFGPQFIQWIKIFYTGIRSTLKVNGFLTNYVPIHNSLRQGCPISALCYVIAAEPLLQAILKNKNMKGIEIPNSKENSKIFAHADDFTLTVRDKESINQTFEVLDLYSKASGAKINKQKSEIMCLGSGSISEIELIDYGVKLSAEVSQI